MDDSQYTTTKRRWALAPAGLALLLGGCATTTFTSTWKAPDAQPLQFQAGDKVVAHGDRGSRPRCGAPARPISPTSSTSGGRRRFPATRCCPRARSRTKRRPRRRSRPRARWASSSCGRWAGAEDLLDPATYYGGSYYGGPGYGSFWGGGYYGHGWGGDLHPGAIRTDTYVSIETVIYDLRQNKLVWAGRTRDDEPDRTSRASSASWRRPSRRSCVRPASSPATRSGRSSSVRGPVTPRCNSQGVRAVPAFDARSNDLSDRARNAPVRGGTRRFRCGGSAPEETVCP